MERLLTLSGWPEPHAHAAAILALETRIAQVSWTKADQRDLVKHLQPVHAGALQAFAPGFPWTAFLQGAGLSAKKHIIVDEKSAFPKISRIFADTPLDTLKAWLAFTVADTAAPYLSQAFGDAHFEFHDRLLLGTRQRSARWKYGIEAVAGGDCLAAPGSCFGTLNWAVGQLYTARYFPPETKASDPGAGGRGDPGIPRPYRTRGMDGRGHARRGAAQAGYLCRQGGLSGHGTRLFRGGGSRR